MTPIAWWSIAGLCALGAMSPGPSLAVVLHHAVRGSRGAGLVCALSHALGVGVYAFLSSVGLAALLARHAELYRLVALAGSVYLAWLGLRLIRGRSEQDGPQSMGAAPGRRAAAREGFLTALLNPKVALFFLAVFSQFTGADPDAMTVLGLTGIAMAIDGAWYAAVAVAVSAWKFPGFSGTRARTLDRLTGGILVLLAAWMLLQPG